VCTDETIVPGPHGSPARDFEHMVAGSHGEADGSVSVDIVTTVLIDPPYLNQHSGPTAHAHGGVLEAEGLLEGGLVVYGL
jgi:hypothetical protein